MELGLIQSTNSIAIALTMTPVAKKSANGFEPAQKKRVGWQSFQLNAPRH